MISLGTPFTTSQTKALLCGAGELGKEIAIELIRYGVEVIAIDQYENAPAMLVAQRSYVIPMNNAAALEEILEYEKPNYIIPEIEAIATSVLSKMEKKGYTVVPNANAVAITMNREKIRNLAAEELHLPCSKYQLAENQNQLKEAVRKIGIPCIVKPIMSSSGRGQSIIHQTTDIAKAWEHACKNGRGKAQKVIVESFVDFDYEITLLTVRAVNGIKILHPIGHKQINGDYVESWQPHSMSEEALSNAKNIAYKIVDRLGGYGIFGVELFIKGNKAIFNEVSPRPHDTGMVTMISQDQSEFALHAKALLRLPIQNIDFIAPSASKAIIAEGHSKNYSLDNIDKALSIEQLDFRLFGKPEINGHRRIGVLIAKAKDTDTALEKVRNAHNKLHITFHDETSHNS